MKREIKAYIQKWETSCYFDGIPFEAPKRLEDLNRAPSFRKICVAIMKNDHNLKSLGFSTKKCKIYNDIKYDELFRKGKIKQLRLKL